MPRIWIGVHVHAEPPITLLFLGDTGLSPSYGMFRQLCNLLLPPTEKSRIVAMCQQASRSRAHRDQVFRLVPFGSGQNDAITFPRAGQPTPARPRQSNHELRVTRTPVHYLDKRGPP
jgi:hypothetical protein